MKRCRGCGAPASVRITLKWNSDGTSTSRFSDAGVRFCHMECDELRGIIDGMSSRIGRSIDNLVSEGQRKAARSSMDDFLSGAHGLAGSWARSRLIGRPLSMKAMVEVGVGLGQGFTEILERRKGEQVRFRVRHPYCVPLLVGDLWGMFEALNNVTAEATWVEEGDSVTVTLEKVRDGIVWEEPHKLALKKMPTLPGEVNYDCCPLCDIPREFTRAIEWDLERGIVTNRATGRREVTIIVEAINAIIRELTVEAGEAVPQMLCEIEQDYVVGVLGDITVPGTISDYRMLLGEMRALGMGNPVEVLKEADLLTVRIETPFCEPLLAGKVAGYYQVLEGALPQVSWTPGEAGYTVIQAWPA